MKVTVLRMFRTCGERRTGPYGTLTIIDNGPDGFFVKWHSDTSKEQVSRFYARFEVDRIPARTEEDPFPVGKIVATFADGLTETWFFHRELPVSAQKIHQAVVVMPALAQVVARGTVQKSTKE